MRFFYLYKFYPDGFPRFGPYKGFRLFEEFRGASKDEYNFLFSLKRCSSEVEIYLPISRLCVKRIVPNWYYGNTANAINFPFALENNLVHFQLDKLKSLKRK